MRVVGIIPNLDKFESLSLSVELIDWFVSRGIEPVVSHDVACFIGRKKFAVDGVDVFGRSDFLVVLGGDGTILRVAPNAAIFGVPLIGINLGTLGFLTDVECNGAFTALDRVLCNSVNIEKRMMIEVSSECVDISCPSDGIVALNDVCVTRGAFSRIVKLHVYVNGAFFDTFNADGLIVSTPTGSTAYNLSAGGPLLAPNSEMIAITPICPHNLNTRSLVISSADVVRVVVGNGVCSDVHLTCDGQSIMPLKSGDSITVFKSQFYTNIIKTNDLSFFDIVRKKIVGVKN